MFVCSTEEPMYLIANGSLITRVPGDEFFMKDGGVVVVGAALPKSAQRPNLCQNIRVRSLSMHAAA